jgi:polysaccharide biosynthesis/export protein
MSINKQISKLWVGKLRAVSALMAMGLTACQSVRAPLPDISTAAGPAQATGMEYHLQPGDVLESHFAVNSSFNEQAVVAPDGRVSFFYAVDVPAAGLSLAQLRDSVASKAGITDRSFAVVLRNPVGTRVYVIGEVNSPGEIVVNGPITALQAVSRAGGYKLGAQSGESVLIRHDGTAGKPTPYSINLAAAADGRKPGADAQLQPYDILYVPRDRMANVSLILERIRNAVPFSVWYGVNRVNNGF